MELYAVNHSLNDCVSLLYSFVTLFLLAIFQFVMTFVSTPSVFVYFKCLDTPWMHSHARASVAYYR